MEERENKEERKGMNSGVEDDENKKVKETLWERRTH